MRSILLLFLSILFLVSCTSERNKLAIVGTVHFPTRNINEDSIYKVLEQLKPDFILMESDHSNFNSDYSFKRTYDENEWNAVVAYIKENPLTQVRPIGFENRKGYRDSLGLFAEASAVFQVLNRLNNQQLFKNNESKLWKQFETLWVQCDSLSNATLNNLNSSTSDEIVETMLEYQYEKLNQIVNLRNEFTDLELIDAKNDTISLKDYFKKWTQFEYYNRNKQIAENILNYIKSHKGKTFVILIGYKHKVIVSRLLNDKLENLKIHKIEL
ncbi:hypothetical protein [uncultured Croceitalea sp.]|uniref:hypothetical protein n=1 Tax=uncultured Croceitalea sp. TaxID=1798908 RepID=UPI0033056D4F